MNIMIIRNCKHCDTAMKVPPTKERSKFFCNATCRHAYTHISAKCEQCGKEYTELRVRQERTRFCSAACRDKSSALSNTLPLQRVICFVCGKQFETVGSKKIAHKTCSPACANIAKGQHNRGRDQRIEKLCVVCQKPFLSYVYRNRETCSRPCGRVLAFRKIRGAIRNSTIVTCDYCGKTRKLFRSRQRAYAGTFCNMQCYLASKQSGIERKVAGWLDTHHIPYERQHKIGYRTVDFWTNGIVIEVNGCYWHACPCKATVKLNASQRRRVTSDKALQTYCRNRDIQVITIWEHDIDRDDFSAIATRLP